MPTQVFINLPVIDLKKSQAFYEAIGFKNNPQFSDNSASCMVLTDSIFVMLLSHEKFARFTPKKIIDARETAGVLNSLSVSSTAELNETMSKALSSGAREYRDPQDFGFMRLRCFEDLDGHNWELIYLDMTRIPDQH